MQNMSLLDSTKNTIHGFYKGLMESAMSVQTKSAFLEKGTLTPDEFVQAGDKLVQNCPTWTWEEGDTDKKKAWFKNKQYLQTRNVPCLARVSSLLKNAEFSQNKQKKRTKRKANIFFWVLRARINKWFFLILESFLFDIVYIYREHIVENGEWLAMDDESTNKVAEQLSLFVNLIIDVICYEFNLICVFDLG